MVRGARALAAALMAASALVPFGAATSVASAPSAHPRTAAVAAAEAADLSAQGAKAFADLSACVAANGSLLATVVVDESGSLQQTDPEDQRVGGVEAAIDALAGLESSGGAELRVEANLAVFGSDYTELVAWGSPSGEHGQELLDAASGELPWHDGGRLTDYRAALREAQAAIDVRADQIGGPTCTAILWFTDGKLDVGDEGAGEATAAAREELCVPQGIVDGIRASGTTIIALALFTEGAEGSVTGADREQLRAIAEGTAAGGVTCGTTPIPSTSASGAYLRADQPDALRRLFSGAGALIQGGTPAGSVLCPGEECTDGVLTFPVDPAVGSVRLIFETEDGADPVNLVAPDGEETVLAAGEAALPAAEVAVSSRSGLFVTDVVPTSGAAYGEWRLVTDPERVTVIDLYYFWGAELAVDAPDGLVLGEQSEVVVSVHGPDGTALDPSLLSSVAGDVLVDGEPTEARAQGDGTFAVTVDLSGGEAASEIQIGATVSATSAPNEIALGPVTAQTTLPTQLPPSYPTLATSRLELEPLVGDEPATGTLTLTGSDRGDTQACFGAAELAGPPDAGALRLSVPECVDVPAAETVDVEVALTSGHPADGVVTGSLPVTLSGVDAAEDVTLAVPVSSTMSRPVNELARWGIVLGLVLLGFLLAAVVGWIGRRISDRYPLGPDVRSASIPVEVTTAGVRRADGGELVRLDDFGQRLRQPHAVAGFETDGLAFDRYGSWWPWSSLHGRVRATSGAIVVTDGKHAQTLDAEATTAPVELPGTQQFYLVVDPAPVPGASAVADAEGLVTGRIVLLADTPHGIRPAVVAWSEALRDFQEWASIVSTVEGARAARAAAGVDAAAPRRRDRGSRSVRGGRQQAATTPADPRTRAAAVPGGEEPPTLLGRPDGSRTSVPPEPGPGTDRPVSPRLSDTRSAAPSPGTTDDGPPPSLF